MKKLYFMWDNKILGTVLLSYLLVSCGRDLPSLNYAAVLDFRTTDTLFMNDRVERIEFLPLEMADDAVFSDADKVVFRNGLIYIMDARYRRIIAYDISTGDVDFVINRQGRGPGEYLEIRSFAVYGENIYTVDNYNGRVNIYDSRDGTFRKFLDAPFFVSNIEVLDNGDIILAYIPVSHENIAERPPCYRIFIVDKEMKVKRRLFPFDKDYHDPAGVGNYFTRDADRIIFGSFYFDGFTVMDRNLKDYEHIAIHLDRAVPVNARKDIESVQSSGYQYIIDTPVVAGNYIDVIVNEGLYGQEYLYDPYSGFFLQNSRKTAEKCILPPVVGSYDGKIVSLLTDYDLYENAVENGFERMPEKCEELLKKGGYILVFYSMK